MKIIKGFTLLILLSLVGAGLWHGIKNTDLLKLQTLRIEGATPTTEARLRKKITLKSGDGLWSKTIENQAALLTTDPWVESAQVHRIFPRTLVIQVTERKPYAVIDEGRGSFKYVDSSNHIIDRAEPTQMGAYPLILGRDFRDSNLRQKALDLIKSLPETGLLSREDLSDVQFDPDRGFQVRLNKSGILVDVGRDNIPLHIDRARRVVVYLDQHNIDASRIDSDYVKKVLVKVRKGR